MGDFSLGLFTDSVTERLVLRVTLALDDWETEVLVPWFVRQLADRSR